MFFKYSCVYFYPTTPHCPTHPCLSPSNLCLLALSMCPLWKFLDGLSPIFPDYPLPPPLWLLSVCSSFQCLWLYFVCLFVWLGPLRGEILWYLSFTTWIISLSMILSGSILILLMPSFFFPKFCNRFLSVFRIVFVLFCGESVC